MVTAAGIGHRRSVFQMNMNICSLTVPGTVSSRRVMPIARDEQRLIARHNATQPPKAGCHLNVQRHLVEIPSSAFSDFRV